MATSGWSRAEASLVDGEGASLEWLCFGMQGFAMKQRREVAHEPRGRFGDVGLIRMSHDGAGMGGQWLEGRPGPHVSRVAHERVVDPVQGFVQMAMFGLVAEAPAGHVLHEAMNRKRRRFGVALDERIGLEIREGVNVGRDAEFGDAHVQQRLRDRLGAEPGEAAQQGSGGFGEGVERGLPGDGDAPRILHELLVEPVQHLVVFLTPELEVPGKGQPLHRDLSAGLFERKGQSPQLLGQLLSVRGVIGRLPPAFVGPGQQVFDRVRNLQHVERQLIDGAAPLRPPGCAEDMPAAKLVEQFLGGERGFLGIQVVEDQAASRDSFAAS